MNPIFTAFTNHVEQQPEKGVPQVVIINLLKFGKTNRLEDAGKKTYNNPFKNLLDMVSCYFSIYREQNIKRLKDFVSDSFDNEFHISHVAMNNYFIVPMWFHSFKPVQEGDQWMVFDRKELDLIIEDSFFDEYHKTMANLSPIYNREYPWLDLYTFVRLEAYATTVLPQSDLWEVNFVWNYFDQIETIINFEWYDTVSIVYKSMGFRWFADDGESDSIKYKWACMALIACKKANQFSDDFLKKDLTTIYKELLIAFTIRGTLEKNEEIVEYVKDCIEHFDDDKINLLIDNIKKLENENNKLINETKQLNEGLNELRKQIRELQNTVNRDFDEIDEISSRISSLSPQDDSYNDSVKIFESIWHRLDKSTRKDIKLSLSMFELFNSFDLAMFPMIRSLEHEINEHIFVPFHFSSFYKSAGSPLCKNKFYSKTHESLMKKAKSHPTMGNILFIGKAVNDASAIKSSNLIKAFVNFLGDRKDSFYEICNCMDKYRIGAGKYRFIDLRNGIAHGDDVVTSRIDKRCYEDVKKFLYEPPMQILIKVVSISFK